MELHTSTGSRDADAVAQAAVAAISQALPTRVRCVVVIGSRADGSASPSSDLDLVVWLRGSATPGEIQVAEEAARAAVAGREGPVFDLTIAGESDETWEKSDAAKCSKVVAGEDVRAALPAVPDVDDAYIAETIDWSLRMQRETVRPTGPLSLPLTAPDPADSMLGYVIHTQDGIPTTRPWVNLVGTIAKFRIEMATRTQVASKTYALTQYGSFVGDDWTSFLDAMHTLVRRR